MAQHDYDIANDTAANVRADINNALEAIATNNSGASEPSTTYANQWWYDTDTNILKFRNEVDTAWIDFVEFDQVNSTWKSVTAGGVSGRNLIINGSGRINQRAYTSGTATSSADQYTLDRWRVVTSGQNLSFTGNDAGRTMTAPAGGVEQEIEGASITGGTYVISFTGTATCTVDGVTKSSGDTVTLTANTNATVRFTSGTFTNVQLEKGNVATPFEERPIGQELAMCQRYTWVPDSTDRTWAMYPSVDSGTSIGRNVSIPWPVTMRAAPTVSYTLDFAGAGAVSISKDKIDAGFNAFNAASGNNITITLVDAEI